MLRPFLVLLGAASRRNFSARGCWDDCNNNGEARHDRLRNPDPLDRSLLSHRRRRDRGAGYSP